MNTTTILYVGIDVSKDKSDICIKDQNGNDLIQRFKITNSKADLGHLYETIERIRSKTPGKSDVVFGMEATGIYSLPLYSALKRDGYKVKLYNPIQTNGFRKINIRKTKTDPIDSAIIADMLRHSEPPQVSETKDLNLYQLRELVRIRHRLIEKQTLCKVQLVRNIDTIWPDYSNVMKRVLGAGIGDILGPSILGEIGNVDRFSSVKKLIAFAGLDPVVSQSGRFENMTGPISKRGSPLLRQALFLAANVARQNDDIIKRFYDKKISEGKHHFSALNAVAAKLLRIVYWVLKNNKEYQTPLN